MEKQKLPEQHLSVVFNVTNWSVEQVDMMVYRKDAVRVYWDNVVEVAEGLQQKVTRLEEEIKRLKWMMTEHD